MRTDSRRERRDWLIAAYSELGRSNIDIARILDVSEAEVSKALKRLSKAGRLSSHVEVEYLSEEHRESVVRALRHLDLERALKESFPCLGDPADEQDSIWVVPVLPGAAAGRDPDAMRTVARFGADKLLRYLKSQGAAAVRCGVSYGQTIGLFVEEVRRLILQSEGRRYPNATVFPIAGDLMVSPADLEQAGSVVAPLRHLASGNARELARVLGTQDLVQMHLPGWLPLNEDLATAAALTKCHDGFVSLLSIYGGFRSVFGADDRQLDPDSLLYQADVLFTGVGTLGTFRETLKLTERLSRPDGQEYAIAQQALANANGDMSGMVLPKGGYGPGDQEAAIGQACFRAHLEHYRHVYNQARKGGPNKRLGVCVLAAGAEKAAALTAALQSQVVNHLVISDDLARAVLAWQGAHGG